VFVQRFLNMLLNRVTLLRMTSMTQADRIGHSLVEIETILNAIEAGDENTAEQACVLHIRNAAAVALGALREADVAAQK
jgi:DNA-binding GntR family transcriptional regulator